MKSDWHKSCSDGQACSCDLARRRFVQLTGLAAAAAVPLPAMPIMAGPFEDENAYLRIIPQDKRLDPGWVRSLQQRGEKETYQDPRALRHIGMPVGGLFAGTLYLSGDGRLWLWDIFNRDQRGILPRELTLEGAGPSRSVTGGLNYVQPAPFTTPLEQRFALRIGHEQRPLDLGGFSDITFDGRYPMAAVNYRDADCPLTVRLEAFSPFIPLNVDDSSLPATILRYTIRNESDRPVDAEIRGWLENAVALYHRRTVPGNRANRILRDSHLTMLCCSAHPTTQKGQAARRDILFADFEGDRYQGWTAEGRAFGDRPAAIRRMPRYQGNVGGRGRRVVNSHASAPGRDVRQKDAQTGTLTSEPFTIQRRFIHFLLGGGNHPGLACLNLLIDDKVVASATGANDNRMAPHVLNVSAYQGKTARIQIVDRATGRWGNIGVDQIVFSDRPQVFQDAARLTELHDYGTMALALLASGREVTASAECDAAGRFDDPVSRAVKPLEQVLIGTVGRKLALAPRASATVPFVLAWHFPNFYSRGAAFPRRGARRSGHPGPLVGHWYAARFQSAESVARYVAGHFQRLCATTRRWVETWYDSTLPWWLLDRTMASTSTLATTTCYRFRDGRFWAWEGIGCCPGTCTHVWHYAQAPGRLFPQIERTTRERVDFGLAQHEDGGIGMRAGLEEASQPAHDGQCGRILGAYREHQMCADDCFLRRIWPRVKRAIQYMIDRDGDADGIVEGPQPNTLDAAWYGKVSWLASLYLAALRAGQAMAAEMGDQAFAARCRTIAERGARNILKLYNGEYFIQIEDPEHRDEIGVGAGCHIDQVFGQTWAHWVGLGRLFDRQKQLSALRALWKYNFVPDVGPFREHFKRGRWYAMAGDAGLLMGTWPKGGRNPNRQKHWQSMYFNECMTGFEWQAAAHMIWEGHDQPDLLEHGLAVARAIHDRYNARLRNPYNEIECSDHYARAMASYGALLAACGYQYHGPKGHLGFAPRVGPDEFRCPFTAAEGWGTFSQRRSDAGLEASIRVRHGTLRLRSIALVPRDATRVRRAALHLNGKAIPATLQRQGNQLIITLAREATVGTEQSLKVIIR